MALILHLGGSDLLAGAKRYRRHLIDQGDFRSLADKIAATPAAAKLVGATHLYLWDTGLLGLKDVRDRIVVDFTEEDDLGLRHVLDERVERDGRAVAGVDTIGQRVLRLRRRQQHAEQ